MKVADLIKKLKKLPQDSTVVICGAVVPTTVENASSALGYTHLHLSRIREKYVAA